MRTEVLYLSPRCKELLGYPEPAPPLTFATFAAWLHPDDHAYVLDQTRAHAVAQIAASSQEQVLGMTQAAGAMAIIKTASDHNLARLQQIGTAVQQLQGVGQTLQALIEQRTGKSTPSEDAPAQGNHQQAIIGLSSNPLGLDPAVQK